MKWSRLGRLPFHAAPNCHSSHKTLPVPIRIGRDTLRILYGTRDTAGKSHLVSADFRFNDTFECIGVQSEPLLPLGSLGTFDEDGIMPSSIVEVNDTLYLFYIGWSRQVSVPYKLAIGLASSEDRGASFSKMSEGPLLSSDFREPLFNTAPYVLMDEGLWRMWYVSCTSWLDVSPVAEPQYNVKYAESKNGTDWDRLPMTCIDYSFDKEAIGRPCVFKFRNSFHMIFSSRSVEDYRNIKDKSYRLGYARSKDGLNWSRDDSKVGLDRADDGWDSEMIEYANVLRWGERYILFYNGNGFGLSGIGAAELIFADRR
jgi:hypothetical protein